MRLLFGLGTISTEKAHNLILTGRCERKVMTLSNIFFYSVFFRVFGRLIMKKLMEKLTQEEFGVWLHKIFS